MEFLWDWKLWRLAYSKSAEFESMKVGGITAAKKLCLGFYWIEPLCFKKQTNQCETQLPRHQECEAVITAEVRE